MEMKGPMSTTLHASAGTKQKAPARLLDVRRTELTEVQRNSDPGTILAVDGSACRRRSLGTFLRGLRHTVREIGTTEDAFQIVCSERVDLVIVDVMTPDMGGVALCRAIRGCSENPLLPVITLGRSGQS